MKRLAIAIFFLAAAASTWHSQVPLGTSPPQIVVVIADKANLRSEPKAKAKVVGSVKKDFVLDVYAYEPNEHWYLVKSGKVVGWIKESLVTSTIKALDDLASLPDLPFSDFDVKRLIKEQAAHGWDLISSTEKQTKIYFYKPSMLQRSGSVVRVWAKAIASSFADETDNFLIINCTRYEFAILNSIKHKPDGTVETTDYKGMNRLAPISPDSIIFSISRVVCKKALEIY